MKGRESGFVNRDSEKLFRRELVAPRLLASCFLPQGDKP